MNDTTALIQAAKALREYVGPAKDSPVHGFSVPRMLLKRLIEAIPEEGTK